MFSPRSPANRAVAGVYDSIAPRPAAAEDLLSRLAGEPAAADIFLRAVNLCESDDLFSLRLVSRTLQRSVDRPEVWRPQLARLGGKITHPAYMRFSIDQAIKALSEGVRLPPIFACSMVPCMGVLVAAGIYSDILSPSSGFLWGLGLTYRSSLVACAFLSLAGGAVGIIGPMLAVRASDKIFAALMHQYDVYAQEMSFVDLSVPSDRAQKDWVGDLRRACAKIGLAVSAQSGAGRRRA